ncbi:MAG: RNA polymerase sigma factor RpoD, partial [Telluria sp.]
MKNTAKTLTLTATKAPRKSTAQLAVPKTATSYFLETEAAATVTVVKKGSRLAAVNAAETADVEVAAAEAPAEVAAAAVPVVVRKRSRLAAVEPVVEAAPAPVVAAPAVPEAAPAAAPKAAKVRVAVKKTEETPPVSHTAPSVVSDAATLAKIDTSGYLLPGVKVPGRRGRKPSEFMPENDEVAALNA